MWKWYWYVSEVPTSESLLYRAATRAATYVFPLTILVKQVLTRRVAQPRTTHWWLRRDGIDLLIRNWSPNTLTERVIVGGPTFLVAARGCAWTCSGSSGGGGGSGSNLCGLWHTSWRRSSEWTRSSCFADKISAHIWIIRIAFGSQERLKAVSGIVRSTRTLSRVLLNTSRRTVGKWAEREIWRGEAKFIRIHILV